MLNIVLLYLANSDILAIVIASSVGGVTLLVGLVVGVYCYTTKINPGYRRSKKISDSSDAIVLDELKL
jgi:zinc transporter ZupT